MDIQIIDLDNCISDDFWRLDKITNEAKPEFFEGTDNEFKYHLYHLNHIFDKSANLEKIIGFQNIIMTARPACFFKQTMLWLEHHGFFPHIKASMFRPIGCDLPSVELKKQMVEKLKFETNVNIIKAYDDRQDIVDMYKNEFDINSERLFINDIH